MESVIAAQGDTVAIGNMRVNARGDLLGPGGEVIKTADERAREHYKNADSSVDNAVSVKSTQPITADPGVAAGALAPQTAKTAKAESKIKPDPEPVVEKQQEEIDPEVAVKTQIAKNKAQAQSKEPIGFKEVELPNGDIEMVPLFEDDWVDDE
jgi:hypothetical protein